MYVHLIDGTYELFRHYYALPGYTDKQGHEVGAVRGVLNSLLTMLEEGATHIGIATDHVVESFRNELYEGYKTGEGIEEALLSQFPILEEVLESAGFKVWAMVEYEADDAIATMAATADADNRVERVWICSPDKDFGQCVRGNRVVQLDRRRDTILDADAVREKFGVPPESIPDYLALVGDSADGFPGLKGWGASSSAAVLSAYKHIDAIPASAKDWTMKLQRADKLAETLQRERNQASLFLRLATLVTDLRDIGSVDELEWNGPQESFDEQCRIINTPDAVERAASLIEHVVYTQVKSNNS
jgi:5'-3' exonuclease